MVPMSTVVAVTGRGFCSEKSLSVQFHSSMSGYRKVVRGASSSSGSGNTHGSSNDGAAGSSTAPRFKLPRENLQMAEAIIAAPNATDHHSLRARHQGGGRGPQPGADRGNRSHRADTRVVAAEQYAQGGHRPHRAAGATRGIGLDPSDT